MTNFRRQFLLRGVMIAAMTATFSTAALAADASHDEIANRVWIDAKVVERVASTAQAEFPDKLLGSIVDEDIDLLRGRRTDTTYEWAHFEKIETGRVTRGASINAGTKSRADRAEIRGRHVFRIEVEIPTRRMVVARNPAVKIARIDFDYTNEAGEKKFESFRLDALLAPGDKKAWDLPEIASDVVATVWGRSTGQNSNLDLSLIRAQLFDDTDGPFFGAVQSAKLLRTAIERKDADGVKTVAATLASRLEEMGARSGLAQAAPSSAGAAAPDSTTPSIGEIYIQIQQIEDLLTGTEAERRTGLDKLHQLVRTLRHAALR